MRPLAAFAVEDARALRGLVFDLDGTVLSGGRLTLEAYAALHELREAGLRLVACTGRPAGWAAVIARQWPVDLAVAENGAVAYRMEGARLVTQDRLDAATRAERRARLDALVAALRARFPAVPLADDNPSRLTDVTFDVRETASIEPATVAALRRAASELGARTFESSIHVHVTLDGDDKASGTVRAVARTFGEDRSTALGRYAFVGDSGNDDACFAAFRPTFAVANVARWLGSLSVPPRYLAAAAEGAGFAEIARRIVALRKEAAS